MFTKIHWEYAYIFYFYENIHFNPVGGYVYDVSIIEWHDTREPNYSPTLPHKSKSYCSLVIALASVCSRLHVPRRIPRVRARRAPLLPHRSQPTKRIMGRLMVNDRSSTFAHPCHAEHTERDPTKVAHSRKCRGSMRLSSTSYCSRRFLVWRKRDNVTRWNENSLTLRWRWGKIIVANYFR